jgi:hypothetical protein
VFEGKLPVSRNFRTFRVVEQAGCFPKDPGKKGSIRVVPVKNAPVKALLLAGRKTSRFRSGDGERLPEPNPECVRHAVSLWFVSLIAQLPDAPDSYLPRGRGGAILETSSSNVLDDRLAPGRDG